MNTIASLGMTVLVYSPSHWGGRVRSVAGGQEFDASLHSITMSYLPSPTKHLIIALVCLENKMI